MILENIKAFFEKKANGEKVGKAPEGVCPNCWGREEWDNHYYKEIKDQNILPGSEEHNSFVKKIADRFGDYPYKNGTKYVCQDCKIEY